MSPHVLTITVLVLIFLIGTLRNVNLGILGLIGAFIVGLVVPGFGDDAGGGADGVFDQVFAGFPVDLMIALMGLTYLFGFAQQNGTIDIILDWAMKAVRGNRAVMPWIFFALTGAFMSIGAIFAIGVISPLAIPFARRYRINQLMMGMMVVHGGMAGLLSPLSVYGIYVNDFLRNNDLGNHQWTLFLMALGFNVLMGIIVYVFLGGRHLFGALARADQDLVDADESAGLPAEPGATTTRTRISSYQIATMVGLAALVIGAGIFGLNIGVVSLIIGGCLAILKPTASHTALSTVSWSTIVLVGGMITYIEVLEAAGTVDVISDAVSSLGAPLIGLLLLCYLSGIVSALASSIATIGIAITMAAPFLVSGDLPIAGTAAAIAIAATVVDVSPFSTNGAMVLANVDAAHRDQFFRQMLIYSGVVVVIGPLLAWLLVFLPF
ncbi:Dicarboxylate carrier MatC domain-containing protein [Corynebacterium glyciniphilum AJ 3170]|uniref:Dicarboxylate carrier MatC domain-containing protein n=1 Tax=Corynebacterium glyciniphilum AJ 3170 TaxID=1404245 RepID=X5EA36_9CORY|nr:SLC13 family permease [Corynebacterium glyciniphilum]AHW63516.1 Dicarboxylate carrier MatC domain-containing protein [Corynebacterium glyciniphilum AJ 3170]